MTQIYFRHALRAGYCREGVLKWMTVYGVSRNEVIGPNAPGVSADRVRTFGPRGVIVADIAEEEAARGKE